MEKSHHKYFGLRFTLYLTFTPIRAERFMCIYMTDDTTPKTLCFSVGEEANWSQFINLSETQQTRLGQKTEWEGGIRKSSGVLVFSK